MHRVIESIVPPALLLAIASLLPGCAGSGAGLDANGQPISGGQDPLIADFASIQSHVFTPICAACHAGAAAPLGFRLDAASAYAMLVNAPSVEVPALARVLPGHPESSYLIQKIEGHAAVGGQMPLGQPPLPQSTIDVIRQWITDGAQASATMAASSGPTQLRAVTPLGDGSLSMSSTDNTGEIVIAADGELDLSSVNAASVTLIASGGDGSFMEGNEIPIDHLTIAVRSLAPTVLAIRPASGRLAADTYQLTIAGTGSTAALDLSGAAVDGAGTGAHGTDFVMRFSVGAQP
jgi:hypothetical protein